MKTWSKVKNKKRNKKSNTKKRKFVENVVVKRYLVAFREILKNKFKLLNFLILCICSFFLGIFLVLIFRPHLSLYAKLIPLIGLFSFTIIGLQGLTSKKENYKLRIKIIASIIIIFFSVQVITPVFSPKVKIDNIIFTHGEIMKEDGYRRQDFGKFNVDLTITPPLFPIDNCISIPFAISKISEADYEEYKPLFSRIETINKNEIIFCILGDGWKYTELKTKISFLGDKYPTFETYITPFSFYPLNFYLKNQKKEGKVYFYEDITSVNRENISMIYKNYSFSLDNAYYSKLKEIRSNYTVDLCFKTEKSCYSLDISIDGSKDFKTFIDFEEMSNSENMTFKIKYMYLKPESTNKMVLIFNPIKNSLSAGEYL